MKAVILAAGEGARMGPFTASVPKVMIPVGNRPRLESTVQSVVENGVRDLVLVVGYRRERIQSHFQDGKAFHARITYVTQTKQLGTAHAVAEARSHLDGPFLVLNGSNLVDGRFVEDLLGSGGKPAVLITQSERPRSYGVATVEGDRLVAITEKPVEMISNLINTGAYALDERIFEEIDRLAKDGKHDLPSAVSALAERTPVLAIRTEGTWVDALYPWDLLRLNATALKGTHEVRSGTIEPAVTIRGRVSIGDGCVIRSGAYLQGPLSLGPGCEIGPNAVLLPSTSLGKNVRIGAHTSVANSILMDDVILGPASVVQDGVIGSGVVARAGLLAAAGAPDRFDRIRPHAMGDPWCAIESQCPSPYRLHGEDRPRPQRDHRELRGPPREARVAGPQVRQPDGHREPRPPDRVVLRRESRGGDPQGPARRPRILCDPGDPRGRAGQGRRRPEREPARRRRRPGRGLPRVRCPRPPAVHGPRAVRHGPRDGRHHAERRVDPRYGREADPSGPATDHVVPRGRGEGRLRPFHAQGDPRGAEGNPRDVARAPREPRSRRLPVPGRHERQARRLRHVLPRGPRRQVRLRRDRAHPGLRGAGVGISVQPGSLGTPPRDPDLAERRDRGHRRRGPRGPTPRFQNAVHHERRWLEPHAGNGPNDLHAGGDRNRRRGDEDVHRATRGAVPDRLEARTGSGGPRIRRIGPPEGPAPFAPAGRPVRARPGR